MNQIENKVTKQPDYEIKRFRVSKRVKKALQRYARHYRVSQRDIVTKLFIATFGTDRRAIPRILDRLRRDVMKYPERGPLSATVEIRVGKAVGV